MLTTRGIEAWDRWLLGLARYTSTASKDPSTKVGSVIARPDHSIVSLGFNGFPKGMPDDPALYENREQKYSRVIHAEMNALMFAGERLDGCTAYTWPMAPCDRCCVHLLQKGIRRFVFPGTVPERWREARDKTIRYLTEAGGTFGMYDEKEET